MADMSELNTAAVEQDATLASAVSAMPDIEALERGQSVDRAADGKFETKAPEQKPTEPKAKEPEAKAAPVEDDEDYIELPPEAEGAEAKRIKLSEALERYNKFDELQGELTKAKESQPPPTHYEEAIARAADQAAEYLRGVQQLQQWLQPQMPDTDLVNPNSDKFDPASYHRQLAQAQQVTQLRAQLEQEAQRVEAETTSKQRAVLEARIAREKVEAMKVWPELKDEAVRTKAVQDFATAYKFTPEEVKAIGDHRIVAVMKDALAYRQGLIAKEAALKVVTAKPKLVKASARASQSSKAANFASASERLAKSNSIDDAADAIGALLG
jgi:hypothetical protein